MKKNSKNNFLISVISVFVIILFLVPASAMSGCFLFKNLAGQAASGEEDTGEDPETTVDGQTPGSEEETGNGTENTGDTSTGSTAPKPDQTAFLDDFNEMLAENAMPDELIAYMDLNLDNLETDTVKYMLEKLEYTQKSYLDIATQYLFEGDGQQKLYDAFKSEEEFVRENADFIADENLRNDILKMLDGGFKFINLEGSYYPIIDFQYLKKYSENLDQEYNSYLDVRAAESNRVYSRDAGLTISWDELAGRMLDCENYLVAYPEETPRRIEIGRLMLGYFSSYIYGQDNTPNRDWETKVVYDEAMQSYKKTVQENPDSFAAGLIGQFVNSLEGNGLVLSDEILEGFEGYITEVVKEYLLDSDYMLLEQIKNLNYPSNEAVFGYIKLTDGKYVEKNDNSDETLAITFTEFVATGNLDSNPVNDAAAILTANPGGSGTFYYLHAIYNGGFYIYSIANIFLGDRIKIKSLKIDERLIYIDMVVHTEDDPACCPSMDATRVFKLEGYDLTEIQ